MRFTLDANVLVYAVDSNADHRHDEAAELVRDAARSDCVLTLQALGEFVNAATRRRRRPISEIAGFVGDWTTNFPVHAASPRVLPAAIEVVDRHGLAFWDAMLWAAAHEAGCAVVLSEDFQDGRSLDGVTFINPFADRNAALHAALLGGEARRR